MRSRINRVCVWLLVMLLPMIILSCSSGGGGGGTTDTGTGTTDTAPPTLVSTTPTGKTNVSVNSLFCATFSEKIDPSSLTSAHVYIPGVTTTMTSKCSSVCLNPTSELTYSTSYALTISDVTDTTGNVLVTPYTYTFITSSPVKAIAAGDSHSIALKDDGTVWTWGYNANGQLGDGTTTQRTSPVQVNGLTNISAISGGSSHTVALKNDGTVWTWGYNFNGQLGDGTTTQRTSHVQVSGLTNVSDITGGYSHTIALKNDGTVWTWGYNANGQLGDGTTTQRTSPVQVNGLTNITAIEAGYYLTAGIAGSHSHSIALKNDGTVWTWGDNSYGQLGDGTTNQRTTPVQVSGLTNVLAIAGGYGRSFALKNDGTVWGWGELWYMDGPICAGCAPVDYTRPSQILADVLNISAIAASDHGVALITDGTVKTWDYTYFHWGYNGLGDGTITSVSAVAAGDLYTITLKNDGTVWTWGENSYGQLGNGTNFSSNAPVKVNFSSSALTAPAALSGVTATAGDSKITVSWSETPGATSYDIYYSTSSAVNTTTGTEVECVTSPYTITNLTPGIPYYTCVVASNGYGNSACSNIASATTTGVTPPPPPPPSGNCPAIQNKCGTISDGIEWVGTWAPNGCCPSGMSDDHGGYLNSLCGLSGTGHGCTFCGCP